MYQSSVRSGGGMPVTSQDEIFPTAVATALPSSTTMTHDTPVVTLPYPRERPPPLTDIGGDRRDSSGLLATQPSATHSSVLDLRTGPRIASNTNNHEDQELQIPVRPRGTVWTDTMIGLKTRGMQDECSGISAATGPTDVLTTTTTSGHEQQQEQQRRQLQQQQAESSQAEPLLTTHSEQSHQQNHQDDRPSTINFSTGNGRVLTFTMKGFWVWTAAACCFFLLLIVIVPAVVIAVILKNDQAVSNTELPVRPTGSPTYQPTHEIASSNPSIPTGTRDFPTATGMPTASTNPSLDTHHPTTKDPTNDGPVITKIPSAVSPTSSAPDTATTVPSLAATLETNPLGDNFLLDLGKDILLTVEEAESLCPLLYEVLLLCVQTECSNFVEVCPTSSDSPSQGDLGCGSISETICKTYSRTGCCMMDCLTEMRALAICVIDDTIAGTKPLACNGPVCQSRGQGDTSFPISGQTTSNTGSPAVVDISPTQSPATLDPSTKNPTATPKTSTTTNPTAGLSTSSPTLTDSPTTPRPSLAPTATPTLTDSPTTPKPSLAPTAITGTPTTDYPTTGNPTTSNPTAGNPKTSSPTSLWPTTPPTSTGTTEAASTSISSPVNTYDPRLLPDFDICREHADCGGGTCALGGTAGSYICCPNGQLSAESSSYCSGLPIGTSCGFTYMSYNSICASGLCINDVCVSEPLEDYAACGEHADCRTGACALDGTAGSYMCCPNGQLSAESSSYCGGLPIGTSCGFTYISYNSICASGLCINDECVGEALEDYSPCAENADCRTGVCAWMAPLGPIFAARMVSCRLSQPPIVVAFLLGPAVVSLMFLIIQFVQVDYVSMMHVWVRRWTTTLSVQKMPIANQGLVL
ncbi:expressed unknown protein [Seminavis robusta]|uniref:Uncharacterized protein n=1 Tax=Seminavis robusta TaxID=568900 RepID=A0A9N8DDG5_9STRA|nr:expressed unknown protein [Seminavis robusta]|eukprot:Sro44_g026570.1 n/a (866) ;mRNA; f:48530-51205